MVFCSNTRSSTVIIITSVVIFTLFLTSISVIAENSEPTQTIKASNLSGSWQYCITIQSLSGPSGIKEIIPPGFSYETSNLPDSQVKQSGELILLALPKGGNLSFNISSDQSAIGTVSGSYTNYLTSDQKPLADIHLAHGSGTLENISRTSQGESKYAVKKSSGPGFSICGAAFLISVLLLTRRRIQ